MTERKIIYEENPEDVETLEDLAAKFEAKIEILLQQIQRAPTVKLKDEAIQQISRLRKKLRERLKQFGN
ncbi:hypothetical protein LCGC14_1269340 [marine sediment metagenome]|uniref:Uncharacterized protein n=1 Tax=marine sediment metagenome TaxID=412755 RepID=A0A0F9NFC6_9ZZZZ|nr:hypothetical protein [bacterium]